VSNYFELALENDKLLNHTDLVGFCVANQHKDIVLQVNNEGHCLRFCSVYDILDKFEFASVELRTWNILEQHPTYKINTNNWDYWLTATESYDYSFDYSWTGEKLFGCFYGRPSAARLGIASHLHNTYTAQSLVKIKFDSTTEDSRKLFDVQRLYSWHPAALQNIHRLDELRTNEEYNKGHWRTNNPLNYLYKDILIDIVAEPTSKGNTFYPTEKIVRPILFNRPFIVMGSKNYLIYLRQMGFKTFYEYWDEDYDGHDGSEKYHRILKLIDQLALMSKQEVADMHRAMLGTLAHNRNILLNKLYSKKIVQVD
jgi:hypothetical protein